MGYYLEDILTGECVPAVIERLSKKEILLIHNSNRFDFDWNSQFPFEVFGLRIAHSGEVVGLMSLECRTADSAIEIKLLENARSHIGSGKRYERIAGSLIAFACTKSVKLGFQGYVCLKPKTHLINYYRRKYGFCYTGIYMISVTNNSLMLIHEYNEGIDEEGSENN